MLRKWSTLAGLVLVTMFLGSAFAAEPQKVSPLGKKIDAFDLQDFRGKHWTQADFKDQKVLVVAFLGCECPLAKAYGPKLAKMAAEFEKQAVAFIGIDANVDLPMHRPLAQLGPGDLFGEMTCRTDQPRSATVQAREPCVMVEMLPAIRPANNWSNTLRKRQYSSSVLT